MGISGADLEGAIENEKQMARMEAIVLSMTVEERQNPKLLNPSRKTQDRKGRRRGHRSCKPLHQAI